MDHTGDPGQARAHGADTDRSGHGMSDTDHMHTDHAGHDMAAMPGMTGMNHTGHGGHMAHVARFRRLFWIMLVLAVPTVALSRGFAMMLGLTLPDSPWVTWIPPLLGTVMYL